MSNFEEKLEGEKMNWDFFFRLFNRDKGRMLSDQNVRVVTLQLPMSWDCATALQYARSINAIPVGTHVNGCFEVQTDLGIWSHKDGKKMDFSTERKSSNVQYKTWEEMEEEEEMEEMEQDGSTEEGQTTNQGETLPTTNQGTEQMNSQPNIQPSHWRAKHNPKRKWSVTPQERDVLMFNQKFVKATMRGLDFHGAEFTDSQFYHCNMENCDLRGTHLSGAVFVNSKLNGVMMQDTVGERTFMVESEIQYAEFNDCNFLRANFNNSNITGTTFKGSNLFRASFDEVEGEDGNFIGADLRGASFRDAVLTNFDFTGAELDGADFTDAILHACVFDSCSLQGANFTGADLTNAYFEKSRCKGANFTGVKAQWAHFDGAHFRDADFTRALLEECCLVNCKFINTTMEDTEVINSNLSQVWIEGVQGDPLMDKCDLSSATIKDSDFDFTGAEDMGCNLDGVTDGSCPF